MFLVRSGMVSHMASKRRHNRAALPAAAAAAAVLAVTLAACGGGGGEGASPSPSRTTSTAPATPGPSRSPSATATTHAEQQVKENWEKFFSPNTPLSQKAALLENGNRLQPLLQAFSGDPRVGQVQATVKSVEITSPTEATVTYTLSLKGTPVLPNATGTSVLQDDVWKVSVRSLCSLVGLDTSATAVPGC
jgi:hypothetical protein